MYQGELKIPKERIAIMIGQKGAIKRELEKKTCTKLFIDAKENLVTIRAEHSIDLYKAEPVIRSIGYGFNPRVAERLLDEECCLETIEIKEFAGKSRDKFVRLKSRCIGKNGKARKNIEQLTNTHIAISDSLISIIGKIEEVIIAKQAMENLLHGSKHSNVYRYIIKRKGAIKAS